MNINGGDGTHSNKFHTAYWLGDNKDIIKMMDSHIDSTTTWTTSEHSENGFPELYAEVAVDKRVHTTGGRAQPLRDREEHVLHKSQLSFCLLGSNENVQPYDIQRHPEYSKHHRHHYQHAHHADFGSVNVPLCFATFDPRHCSAPHSDPDERVEHSDDAQWKYVTGEEDNT